MTMATIKDSKQIDEEVKKFLSYQREYNETGDKDILWFKMEPYIRETAESIIKKLAKNNQILYLDEKVDLVVDKLIARYTNDYKYSKNLPKTMIYWACYGVFYSDESKSFDAEKRVKAMLKEKMYDDLYRNGEEIYE